MSRKHRSVKKKSIIKIKWRSLAIILLTGFVTLIIPYTIFTALVTTAAPYRPPPPPPPPNDEPIPPPDENNNPPPDTGPKPTEIPTPTPCIPNWCFIEKTACCFDPVCLFLSNTEDKGKNRCPYPKPDEGKYMNSSQPPPVNFFDTIYLFFSKVTGKK